MYSATTCMQIATLPIYSKPMCSVGVTAALLHIARQPFELKWVTIQKVIVNSVI